MPNPGGHSFLFDFAKNQLSHLSTQIGSSRKPAFILSSYSWRLSLIDNASLRMVIRNAHATMITTMIKEERNKGIRTQHSFRAGAIAIEVPWSSSSLLKLGETNANAGYVATSEQMAVVVVELFSMQMVSGSVV